MALRMHIFSPNSIQYFPRFPINPYPSTIHLITTSQSLQISNSRPKNKRFSDSELASELAAEVEKIKTQMVQNEEALNKSRELLFKELCNYMDLETEELKKNWSKMSEDEKWVLVKSFVSDWGSNFHPLSAKSVKGLVDEFLVIKDIHGEEEEGGSAAMLFPTLKKFMGFSSEKNEG